MQSEIGHLLRGLDESVAGTMSFSTGLSSIRQVLVERGIDADCRCLTQIWFSAPDLVGGDLDSGTGSAHSLTPSSLTKDTAAERGLSIHGPADPVFVEDGGRGRPILRVWGPGLVVSVRPQHPPA